MNFTSQTYWIIVPRKYNQNVLKKYEFNMSQTNSLNFTYLTHTIQAIYESHITNLLRSL